MNPFNVLNNEKKSVSNEIIESTKPSDLNQRLKSLTTAANVVVFMKGNAEAPQCGFSANTVAILNKLGVSYQTFNILADEEVRQGLKSFSNWPTYPQIYYKGKLIGGNDVITEMFNNGELKELFNA